MKINQNKIVIIVIINKKKINKAIKHRKVNNSNYKKIKKIKIIIH